jgi:hypothetical protein
MNIVLELLRPDQLELIRPLVEIGFRQCLELFAADRQLLFALLDLSIEAILRGSH